MMFIHCTVFLLKHEKSSIKNLAVVNVAIDDAIGNQFAQLTMRFIFRSF